MRVEERSEDPQSVAPPTPAPSNGGIASQLRQLVLVALIGGLVVGFFLAIYTALSEPIGWDTARYLDQTNLATKFGVSGAAHLVLPRLSRLLGSRVGFPTTVLGLASILHSSVFEASALIPPLAAAAIALSAGAFITYSMRQGVWDLAVVGLVVGTSAGLVQLTGGYTDNLIAEALFATMLVPLVSSVRGGKGFVAATLLLAVGELAHPSFFKVMVAILVLAALSYLPSSWRAWRRHEAPLLSTPSVRLAMILGGGSAIGAVGIYGLLNTVPNEPVLQRYLFIRRIKEDLPLYRLYATVPLAAIGTGSLVRRYWSSRAADTAEDRRPDSNERSDRFTLGFLLTLLGAWVAVTVVGILGLVVGKRWPAHRFLAFLLPLPILMGLGVLSIWRFLAKRATGRLAVAVTAIFVLGLVGMGVLGYRAVARRDVEFITSGRVHDAVAAATYLDEAKVPIDYPVVILVFDTGPTPSLFIPEEVRIFRTVFPVARMPNLYFYVGAPEDFLAGRPTIVSTGQVRQVNSISRNFFESVQPILSKAPVALLLSSYNPAYTKVAAEHPDWIAAKNVAVIQGPRLPAPISDPPFPTAPHGAAIPLLGSAGLIALVLLGAGWGPALLPAGLRPFEVLALAPGLGIAVLILAGIIADSLGIRLVGLGGSLPSVLLAGIGWALAAARLARHGRRAVLSF